MRRFFFLFFLSSSLQAFYTGHPNGVTLPCEGPLSSIESWMAIRLGYLGQNSFDLKLHKTDSSRLWSNGAMVNLDLYNAFSLYGSLDAVRMKIQDQITHTGFGGSIGANAILWRQRHFAIGVNGNYFQASPKSVRYHEWQAGASASYTHESFSPYIGVKYRHAEAKKADTIFSSKIPVGLILGATIAAQKTFAATLEASLINETTLSFNALIRF